MVRRASSRPGSRVPTVDSMETHEEAGKRHRPSWVNESPRDREQMEFGPAVEFQLLE